jgi:hypothetical protein
MDVGQEGRFCGSGNGYPVITSPANEMNVRWKSNSYDEHEGFTAYYAFIPDNAPTMCSGVTTVMARGGIVTSNADGVEHCT